MGQSSTSSLGFIFTTIVFTVVGQLLVKQGMLQVNLSPTHISVIPAFILQTFTNARVVIGLICAVLAAISWTAALSRSDISFAYPFMGLAIVLVLALSGYCFGERLPASRWIGVLIVCFGLWIAARK